ncbi:MAG: hypothetical protein R2702_06405 [Acidimicrobiales bacterium]
MLVHEEGQRSASGADLERIGKAVFRGGIDGEIRSVVDESIASGVAHALLTSSPSAVVVDAPACPADGAWGALPRLAGGTPIVVLRGATEHLPTRVLLADAGADEPALAIAEDVVRRLTGGRGQAVERLPTNEAGDVPSGVAVVVADGAWVAPADNGDGAGVRIDVIATAARPDPQLLTPTD